MVFIFQNKNVDPKNEEQNSVQIIYDIDLGERALIGRIEFIGNKSLKIKNREAIISEEAKFWKFLSNNKFLMKKELI